MRLNEECDGIQFASRSSLRQTGQCCHRVRRHGECRPHKRCAKGALRPRGSRPIACAARRGPIVRVGDAHVALGGAESALGALYLAELRVELGKELVLLARDRRELVGRGGRRIGRSRWGEMQLGTTIMVPPIIFVSPQPAPARVRLMRGYSRAKVYLLHASGLGLGMGVA